MNIEELSYNEIQKELSSRDLKAQGPKEELKERLKDALDGNMDKSFVAKEETLEVEKPMEDDPFEPTKAQVLDGDEVVREYTKEQHGEGFVDKAELYAESHSNPNLIVEKF